MRDSYERFFSEGYITKENFFEFGLKETIYAPHKKAATEWINLKERIVGNETAYIRGFGRNAKGTPLFIELYKKLLGNSKIIKDPTNNAEPTKLIKNLTGYSKTKSSQHEPIRNYQVSHVFGRTKNVYAFTAPWNIVYLPKILDPFTGHEAKGEMIKEFTLLFRKQAYNLFEDLIEDFNNIITKNSFQVKLHDAICDLEENSKFAYDDLKKLKKSLETEFYPIEI